MHARSRGRALPGRERLRVRLRVAGTVQGVGFRPFVATSLGLDGDVGNDAHGVFVDPADRRFHAQPVACHDCGPTPWLVAPHGAADVTAPGDPRPGRAGTDAAIAGAQTLLELGAIVAVKGVGGYHLACRADHDDVLARLRARVVDLPLGEQLPRIC